MSMDNLTGNEIPTNSQSHNQKAVPEKSSTKFTSLSSRQPLSSTQGGNKKKIEFIKKIINAQGVNKQKVEYLQKLIDSQQYKVDAVSIADRLVDCHLKLGE